MYNLCACVCFCVYTHTYKYIRMYLFFLDERPGLIHTDPLLLLLPNHDAANDVETEEPRWKQSSGCVTTSSAHIFIF